MQIPISAANWYPISASYPYDYNLDLKPMLVAWSDGYTAVSHPIFDAARSVVTNRNTMLFLTTSTSFFNVLNEPAYVTASVGSYISLKVGNSFITNVSGSLYLSDLSITDNSFFRLIANIDGTYSFMFGNTQYVTVDPLLPFELTTQNLLLSGDINRQKFNIYALNSGQLYITTTFNNPFSAYDNTPIQRFWSYNTNTSAIECIGMVSDIYNYTEINPFLFTLEGAGIVTTLDGLTRDQTWIQYHNNLGNTINNKNTEIDTSHSISGVNISRLIEIPYHTKITVDGPVGRMGINIANLKNVSTPEYEYHKQS